MSELASPPTPPNKAVTILLFVVGTILLLPGACAIVLAVVLVGDGSFSLKDQIWQMVLMLWGLCFAVSLGGVFILRAARRRRAAADAQ
jgi:hypothetical protein